VFDGQRVADSRCRIRVHFATVIAKTMLAHAVALAPITLWKSSVSVELTPTDANLCLMAAAGRNGLQVKQRRI
jgi:hypothetical protein